MAIFVNKRQSTQLWRKGAKVAQFGAYYIYNKTLKGGSFETQPVGHTDKVEKLEKLINYSYRNFLLEKCLNYVHLVSFVHYVR